MDNAPVHPYGPLQALMEHLGVDMIYLPPYSPFLNSAEDMFGAIKSLVRRLRAIVERDPLSAFQLISECQRDYGVYGDILVIIISVNSHRYWLINIVATLL